jgi:hypothetical protein
MFSSVSCHSFATQAPRASRSAAARNGASTFNGNVSGTVAALNSNAIA